MIFYEVSASFVTYTKIGMHLENTRIPFSFLMYSRKKNNFLQILKSLHRIEKWCE